MMTDNFAVALAAIFAAALIASPALAQESAAPAAGVIPAKYHGVWCGRKTYSSGSYRKHAVEAAGESCDTGSEFTITADSIINYEQTCKVVASLPVERYALVTLDCPKTGLERVKMYIIDSLGLFERYKTQRYLCRGKLTHGQVPQLFAVEKCRFVKGEGEGPALLARVDSVLKACRYGRYCEVSVEVNEYYNVEHVYSARAK